MSITTLEQLLQIAADEGITVDYADSLPGDMKGLHIFLEGIGHIITILKDIKEDKNKYIEILAEELGHYFTSYGDNVIEIKNYRDYLKICKNEKKAADWSANYLVTLYDLERAFKNNCKNYFEIAEFLDVPENTIKEKFRFLASKNNKIITIGEYKIILTNYPNVIVYKEFNYDL